MSANRFWKDISSAPPGIGLGTRVLCRPAASARTRFPGSVPASPHPCTWPHASGAHSNPGEGLYWHQAVHSPKQNCKIKKVSFGALPHFPDSSPLSWNVLPLIEAHRALGLPLSWPEVFYLPPDSVFSRPFLPYWVLELPPPRWAGDLK